MSNAIKPFCLTKKYDGKPRVWDALGRPLFTLPMSKYPALGREIVTAVNSHAALLEACEAAALEMYSSLHSEGDPSDESSHTSGAYVYRQLRAAIALARGEK